VVHPVRVAEGSTSIVHVVRWMMDGESQDVQSATYLSLLLQRTKEFRSIREVMSMVQYIVAVNVMDPFCYHAVYKTPPVPEFYL
jgi:hypothetical protein